MSRSLFIRADPAQLPPAAHPPAAHSAVFPGMQPFGPDPFEPPGPEAVNREEVLRPGENIKEKISRNLFVKVQVDRNTCYVGEPIVATYKLYSRVNAESRVTRNPSLNGFSVYDMVNPGTDAVSVEKLNGKAFTVHTIRKAQLIPLQAGSIDLDPVEVENVVHFVKAGARQEPRRSGDRLRDLLDQLSGEENLGPAVDENVTLDYQAADRYGQTACPKRKSRSALTVRLAILRSKPLSAVSRSWRRMNQRSMWS